MKSNIKNQMSCTKQMLFIFLILFSLNKIPVLCMGTFPPSLFACSFLGRLLPPCSLALLSFLDDHLSWQKKKAKAASEASAKDVPLFGSGMSVVFFWDGHFRLSKMTAPREKGTLTKVERKQEFIRKAKRAEWRDTYCIGVWWMKSTLQPIPAPLSGRWATGDCLLLSLFFTCLCSKHWARCCNEGKALFLPSSFPFFPEAISPTLKLLLSRGGSQYVPLLGAQGLSVGWETVVSDSSFQLQFKPVRLVLPIEIHVFSFLYSATSICCYVHSSVQKHVICEYKWMVSKLACTLESLWELQKLRMPVSHTQRLGLNWGWVWLGLVVGPQVVLVSRQVWEPLIETWTASKL